nr:LytTR family DNA-binding domain-containing protein [uncultured Flavobacterium sp.]
MQVLKVIVIDIEIETIKLFEQFEKENTFLLNIITIIPDCTFLVDLVNENKPDLLIVSLDNDSFNPSILNTISVHKPKTLFVSKDKTNAYNAFKFNGLDFLLKPLDYNELIISFYKTVKFIEMESVYHDDKIGKIKTLNVLHQNSDYVAIASVDKIELLKIDDIIFCKADGKYTEFYVNKDTKIVSSRNLGEYASLLENNFFRIHHSYIVNIKYLVKIIKKDGLYCEFSNGYVLPVAKRRQEEFIKFIKL